MIGFHALSVALSSLRAHQRAIDVTSHNVANVNTPGYSRQDVVLATGPVVVGLGSGGQLGSGVRVELLRRAWVPLLDRQIRDEGARLGYWEVLEGTYTDVQVALQEPGDTGLAARLDAYWSGWSALAADPSSTAARLAVQQAGEDLATTFNGLARSLADQRRSANATVRDLVAQINQIAPELANLNRAIANALAAGEAPNDLEDQRDILLQSLSRITPVEVGREPSGMLNVSLGGSYLVLGGSVRTLTTVVGGSGYLTVEWSDGRPFQASGGELGGQLQTRDVVLADLQQDLDDLATTVMTEVNTRHAAGYGLNNSTGLNFFTGTGALDLALDTAITADLENIAAASAPDSPGDGSNAQALVDVATLQVMAGATQTVGDFYEALVVRIGLEAGQAAQQVLGQQGLVDALSDRKLSQTGVSLDEEAFDLIRYEQAYAAAARVVTAIDEMLDVLINSTGVVGR